MSGPDARIAPHGLVLRHHGAGYRLYWFRRFQAELVRVGPKRWLWFVSRLHASTYAESGEGKTMRECMVPMALSLTRNGMSQGAA